MKYILSRTVATLGASEGGARAEGVGGIGPERSVVLESIYFKFSLPNMKTLLNFYIKSLFFFL